MNASILHSTFLSIIIAIIVSSCIREAKKTEEKDTTPTVEITAVKSLQPSLNITLPGELKAWNKAHLFPKVKGYVSTVLADRGSIVKKGQVLAILEAPEIIAVLNHAKAQVAASEASLIEQRSKHHASRNTYKRILETSQTPGAVSANELEIAYARMMSDSALTNAAFENLHAAQAQLASQSQLVSYLSVKAPFDGNITERNISPGELVGPEGNSKPMFVIEDRSKLRLTIAVPENLANSIQQKSTVTFTIQADPLKEYTATFARSSNTLQENNRSMAVEFDFINVDKNLKAGMYAEVKLPIERNKPTLFVPKTSLLHSTEGVFIVRVNNNTTEWVNVKKGNSLDSLVEIFGGVHEGEKIILKAYDELRNGQAVKVKS
jgi:membrane fusion protein, multidrug efflux system